MKTVSKSQKVQESVAQKKQKPVRLPGELGKELKKNKILFLMLIPAVVFFIAFCYLPMAGSVLAFKNFNYTGGIFGSPWCGFDNFKFLVKSGVLFNVTKNTLLYNTFFYVTGTAFEILLAILFSEIIGKRFKKISQSIVFLPYFVSFVLVGAFVYNMFNYEHGSLNTALTTMGAERVDVYSNTNVWKWILGGVNIWKNVGYGSVVYLAVIMSFDTSYYEAADLDGANAFQKVTKITLPMLKPTVIIMTLMFVSRIMKGQFDLFYNVIGNNAQLYNTTDVIDTYVFRALTTQFNVGLGSAASLYQSAFGLVLIFAVNGIIRKVDKDSALF